MQLTNTLALCAALLTAVVEGRIAFTTLPQSVRAGNPVKLAWEGADGSPITITLKRGPANNLQTVELITGNASGNSYTWTPSTSLSNGSDYALQISQDDTDTNYSGLFTLSGGSSSSGSSSSDSASSTATASSRASSGTVTTTAGPVGTAAPSGGVSGSISTTLSRNTTLSRATLSRTSSTATSSETATTTSEEETATDTASASSSPSPTGAAVTLASNLGLLVAGFAAVVYLG